MITTTPFHPGIKKYDATKPQIIPSKVAWYDQAIVYWNVTPTIASFTPSKDNGGIYYINNPSTSKSISDHFDLYIPGNLLNAFGSYTFTVTCRHTGRYNTFSTSSSVTIEMNTLPSSGSTLVNISYSRSDTKDSYSIFTPFDFFIMVFNNYLFK